MRFLPEARNEFERLLAEERSPAAAVRWGFHMNLSEQSFRDLLEKHLA